MDGWRKIKYIGVEDRRGVNEKQAPHLIVPAR
jgi:hypothetical protein